MKQGREIFSVYGFRYRPRGDESTRYGASLRQPLWLCEIPLDGGRKTILQKMAVVFFIARVAVVYKPELQVKARVLHGALIYEASQFSVFP